jgi:UDP-2,4-diacetamido-2,4,6-trideoxy-beta-L-altropyranose hydrolase
MNVAFRADASLQIGAGHVMRCLTLADALQENGVTCRFICREYDGHLIDLVTDRGYPVHALPRQDEFIQSETDDLAHARWLGVDWATDAQQTQHALGDQVVDWLILDHYALDYRWGQKLRLLSKKIMVIDDLADRPHQCELLLDQNLGRQPQDYANLVPAHCKVLTGPQYALLRPEFAALRSYSLQRRQQPALKRVLITMGGVDQFNVTCQVLQALRSCALPQDCCFSVVVGLDSPWLQQVRAVAVDMPWPTEVLVNISDMAQRMADSDLAIGAAGSTSWERCCLGLPTLLVVLADNQRFGARALQEAQAALFIGDVSDISIKLPLAINASVSQHWLLEMSTVTAAITDGGGVEKVLKAMRILDDYAQ